MMSANTIAGAPPQKFGPDSPYIMFQPFNLVSFLSVFSPIIIVTLVLSYSLFYQNMKGFVYLGFLLASVIVRSFTLQAVGSERNKDNCGIVRYTSYGNPTFSTFILAFTIAYMFVPMYMVGVTNWYLVVFLLFYIIFDLLIKFMQGCLNVSKQLASIMGDLLCGLLIGMVIIVAMYGGGSQRYLFFSDQTSNGNICSMPKKQQFKCQVYKNGELVTNM